MTDRAEVVRREFSTADTDVAEDFLRRGYADSKLTITGPADAFTFVHAAVSGPGFSLNRLRIGVDITNDGVLQPDDPLTVVHPVGGRLAYGESHYPEVQTDTGEVVLFPPVGTFHGVCERFDLAMTLLDRPAVAAYASAMTGLAPEDLTFDRLTPLTPDLGRHWLATVAHVRDHVLADPWSAGQPIVLHQAFRSLAAALLSTFPNTALARTTDPETPAVRGDVSAARLREVVDYLHSHADQPVGPASLAERAGVPYREVAATLQRRHGAQPARLLWDARLAGARGDLLRADPAAVDAVAEIAGRWGFDDARAFAAAYTRTMGESPERTLRR